MRVSKMFTAFAASFFFLNFLKDGTVEHLVTTAARGARQISGSGRRLTKRAFR